MEMDGGEPITGPPEQQRENVQSKAANTSGNSCGSIWGAFCCMRRRKGENRDTTNKVNHNNSSGEDMSGDVGNGTGPGAAKDAKRSAFTGFKTTKGGGQSPVLLELFTSQGCSSCPPGDALISKLGRGQGAQIGELSVPILVLAYHVDYWDYLGWKDPFASPKWTLRQRTYGQALQQDSIYTPEVVVQGRSHVIASNSSSIMSLVQSAPRFAAPDIHATFTQPSPAEMKISLSVTLKSKVESFTLDVNVALYENGLVTDCTKGENRGRILTNDFVVIELEKACTIESMPSKRAVQGEVILPLWEGFAPSKCGIVVFLQNPVSLEVFGAQQIDLPSHIK